MATTNTTSDKFDSPWKTILETFLPDILALLFPTVHSIIDWSKEYISLDKELQKLFPDAQTGKKHADKLFKVYKLNGDEIWIYIHIEVQAQRDKKFPWRMFVYNYRIFDKYNKPVISLAILADDNPDWRPDSYGYGFSDEFKMGIRFPVAKLLDWKSKIDELEHLDNPFALCIIAHLRTLETKKKPDQRKQWKFYLLRLLFKKGYSRKQIKALFTFIDWILRLPEELEEQLWQEVNQLEEVRVMPYVTSLERIAEKRGIQIGEKRGIQIGEKRGEIRGILIGEKNSIINALTIKNQNVPDSIKEKIMNIQDRQLLEQLFRAAILKQSLAEFQQEMDKLLQ